MRKLVTPILVWRGKINFLFIFDRLCFASFSTATPVTTSATTTKKAAAQQVANYTTVLEKSIKALDIGNSVNMSREQHPDPCKDCNVSLLLAFTSYACSCLSNSLFNRKI